MSKVNWAAKASHEYIPNYKLMQTVMTKNHIDKFVDVDRLIKGVRNTNESKLQCNNNNNLLVNLALSRQLGIHAVVESLL